jgi:hypothetical protein
MKYTYYPEFDENDCLEWHVYETATEQVIATFLFEEDAVLETNRLERGGGFDGFTPSFILTKVPQPDINQAFAMEFLE